MSAVLDAIRENLRQVSIVFEPTEASFLPDTKSTGDARELTVKQFLTSFFPKTYHVRKGLIYSRDGRSQEIDCILLAPNHPPLITPIRELTIAEGVHAAIEVKPDIATLTRNSEFHRGLKQIQSVKRLSRVVAYLPTNEVPPDNRIPSVIFAAKSRRPADMVEYIVSCVRSGDLDTYEIPDLIVTLDNGILFHTPSMSTSTMHNFVKDRKPDHSERAFIHFGLEHNTLALFLLFLYSFTPPEPHISDPVLKPYLGFQADTCTIYEY